MEKEYAIQIGGAIWDGDAEDIPRFPSEEAAEFKLKCIEELDAYRPKRPKVKRKIVVREVGPWQTLKQMKKHQKRPYIYLVQKLESIQPKAVCSYRTVMVTTDAERCKRFVALLVFCPAKTFAGSVCVSLLGGIFWPVTVQVVLWKIAKNRIAKPGGLQ